MIGVGGGAHGSVHPVTLRAMFSARVRKHAREVRAAQALKVEYSGGGALPDVVAELAVGLGWLSLSLSRRRTSFILIFSHIIIQRHAAPRHATPRHATRRAPPFIFILTPSRLSS